MVSDFTGSEMPGLIGCERPEECLVWPSEKSRATIVDDPEWGGPMVVPLVEGNITTRRPQ